MAQLINQFAQTPEKGMLDEKLNVNTIPVQIDLTEAAPCVAGQAVKMVDDDSGIPTVTKCTADADNVLGFINYDIKSQDFPAGARAEISMSGNVMYLEAVGAIARGVRVTLASGTVGGVASATSADNVVGWALDKAANGQLLRVMLQTPSFQTF